MDIRLCYIKSCIILVVCSALSAPMKYNADATTYLCIAKGTGTRVLVYRPVGSKYHQVTSTEINSDLIILVKDMALGNARGDIGEPCFIISVPGWEDPDTFFHMQVPGLSRSGSPFDKHGHIFFCRSKCGNKALWNFWFLHVSIPWITSAMNIYKCVDFISRLPQMAFLKMDGEAIILDCLFSDEVVQALNSAKITHAKSNPGLTKVEQEWDAGTMFRDMKKCIIDTRKSQDDTSDSYLSNQLDLYIIAFKASIHYVPITGKFIEKFKESILLIVFCQRKVLLPGKLVKAFIETGTQKAGNIMDGECSVDFDVMMSKCPSNLLTDDDIKVMYENKTIVGLKAIELGYVPDSYLDELGIVCNAKDRDHLTDCRQSFRLTNHPNVQAMHQFRKEYAAELESAKSAISESRRVSKLPESIIAAKEKKTMEAQRLKDMKSFELDLKTAAIAVVRKQQKDDETVRFNLLSPFEKVTENTAKKILKSENKRKAAEDLTAKKKARDDRIMAAVENI